MTVQLLTRLRYPTTGGRWVLLTWADPTSSCRRIEAMHLGDLCDVMPNSFVVPRRSAPPRPPQSGSGRFVSLTELKTWLSAQPDKAPRTALANFLAWADAFDHDNDLEAAR